MREELRPKKYTLRSYQKLAVDRGIDVINRWTGPSVIVLPTGSGKSLVIAEIAWQLPGKTIVFQPSKEILEQNYEKYATYADDLNQVGIYSASAGEKVIAKVVFATIGSVMNNMHLFKDFQNVIIDECHLVNPRGGMYESFIKFLGTNRILGLTATPYRLYSNSMGSYINFITRTRPSIFKNVCHYSQISELRSQGFMANMEYFQVKGFDSSKVKANSTGSEFDEDALRRYYKEINFDNSLLDIVKRLINKWRKNVLVFTQFTEEARLLVSELGDIAAVVTGATPKKEREQILFKFKHGMIKIIANVGVLTTGFDFPELETVVLWRATKSLSLYYQMVGRGIRPHANKNSCWVIDMCENLMRFGKVEDLTIRDGGKWKYYIESRWRQLTNVKME